MLLQLLQRGLQQPSMLTDMSAKGLRNSTHFDGPELLKSLFWHLHADQ